DEAVLRGFSDFVKLLLEAGADPNADNRRTGATPLNEAVYKNQTKIIELLLAHHANSTIKDKSGFSPLANAVRFDHAEAARLLATQATTANSRYEQLQEAIAKGSRPMIVLLLENGADINATFGSGSSPLDLAARQGRDEIVELLLAKGADLDAHDQAGATPLHNAALSGHAAIVGILLDHGANIDGQEIETGDTPLYLAVYLGRDDVVRLLLDRGANPNTCNKAGASPLRAAVAEENKSIAAAIMARGGRETCNQR
ncbi:MAG TPA: ankyrin repeat domain-containing protein, partial [Bryobacteraceae bacterium]|nr:ankyrin repeat domain-containing protein [Bryobacteraceae bacterium]